ncbi:MAG: radical SAM protein, partial [Elusimicrobiota bacterium]
MKIFLIFARKSRVDSYISPIGIMSLAAVLRQKGYHDIRLFDMAFHTIDTIVNSCIVEKPCVIGLSLDSIGFENGCMLLDEIKSKYKDAVYVIGGVHPSIFPKESLLKTGADVAVIGEGEATIRHVVDAIRDKRGFWNIKGTAFIDKGKYIENPPREFIEDLDSIPFPARELLPMERYLRSRPDMPMLYPTITIFASRGCRANCIYCQPVVRALFGKKMRHRSVANIISEIVSLKEKYSFKNLYFTDDELLFNGRDWIEELCTAFIERKLNLRWTCQARVDQIDEELVKLLKRSGCYAIGFGVESGSQKILNYMRKGYKEAHIDRAFEACRRNKIITTCNLMVGTPGESHETIQESIKMLKRIKPNLVRISITTPTPGSDLYSVLDKEKRINVTRLSDFDRWAGNPIKLDNFTYQDIQDSIKNISKVFYMEFFSMFCNPIRFIRELFFIRIIILRYIFLLSSPGRL